MMNGHINVESEPEKGSLFSFTVPYQTTEKEIEASQQKALHDKTKKMMEPPEYFNC